MVSEHTYCFTVHASLFTHHCSFVDFKEHKFVLLLLDVGKISAVLLRVKL